MSSQQSQPQPQPQPNGKEENERLRANKKQKIANGKVKREEKRLKRESKLERQAEEERVHRERNEWIRCHSHFAKWIETNEADDDELLHPYRNLRDGEEKSQVKNDVQVPDSQTTRDNETNDNQICQYFIAEGTETLRVLLRHCRSASQQGRHMPSIQISSILVKPSIFFDEPVRLLRDVQATLEDNAEPATSDTASQYPLFPSQKRPPYSVFIGTERVLSTIAGFRSSRGALACGLVPLHINESWFWSNINTQPLPTHIDISPPNNTSTPRKFRRILALDGVSDTANLGSIIRTGAALGVHVILLSANSCSAWYRRSIRVSMGHVFTIPTVRVSNLSLVLRRLLRDHNFMTFASVVQQPQQQQQPQQGNNNHEQKSHIDDNQQQQQQQEQSNPLHYVPIESLSNIPSNSISTSWCCVMGNESSGISKAVLESCQRHIRIDMIHGVDSLSLPIATGILLHGLIEREGERAFLRDGVLP